MEPSAISLYLIYATSVLENGDIIFSEVKAFLKKQPHVTGTYKSITTSTNQTITLSPNHLIYARKAGMEKYTPMQVYRFVHHKLKILNNCWTFNN